MIQEIHYEAAFKVLLCCKRPLWSSLSLLCSPKCNIKHACAEFFSALPGQTSLRMYEYCCCTTCIPLGHDSGVSVLQIKTAPHDMTMTYNPGSYLDGRPVAFFRGIRMRGEGFGGVRAKQKSPNGRPGLCFIQRGLLSMAIGWSCIATHSFVTCCMSAVLHGTVNSMCCSKMCVGIAVPKGQAEPAREECHACLRV